YHASSVLPLRLVEEDRAREVARGDADQPAIGEIEAIGAHIRIVDARRVHGPAGAETEVAGARDEGGLPDARPDGVLDEIHDAGVAAIIVARRIRRPQGVE